jgi:L-rhamnose-H+ transport protein
MITGLSVLIFAGILQGLFVLPLGFTRNWRWEHNWLMFSFFGMILLNWCLAFLLFPQAISIYREVPFKELLLVFSFGLLWGIGAILFGIGMEKLGMSVGYPVIMGLIAGAGALLPLVLTQPGSIFTIKGAGVIGGCGLVIAGILTCSKASSARSAPVMPPRGRQGDPPVPPAILSGMAIAVLAGLLSALPNIGMTFAVNIRRQAVLAGVSPAMAGNLVWLLFFSFGFIANAGYTLYLIIKKGSAGEFKRSFGRRNLLFTFLSAACWIGSFYLYGFSANVLGALGSMVGWPLFISISIITGNIAGIWKGEWKNAAPGSIRLLRYGMLVFILAIIIIGLSNIL